jgi:hypothetical protein
MIAIILKWLIVLMSLLNAGYMAFDGMKAMLTGDYVRPKSGEYAGQLGPWTKIVEKLGIDPLSTFMKCIFIIFGIAGFIATLGFAVGTSWGWKALFIFNVCSLWNLYFGTTSSVIQIALLVVLRFL